MNGALDGVAVVDLSEGLPGAFATRVLAEAGADVVKVERPGGDPLRTSAPVGFATWNRSKRGVCLDLVEAAGRAGLDELLARADVLVHDLTTERAAALGLDDAAVRARHPHLIVGVVTGYPAWHRRREDPAEEILVQAESGVMDEQQGNRDGPILTRMPYASWCAAFLLAGGVLARLVQRQRTGVVGGVQTSLLQGVLVPTAMYWQRSERLPAMLDQPHTLPKLWPGASLSLFECADGVWIQLAGSLGGWIESPPVLEQLALRDEIELSESGVTAVNLPRWQSIFRGQDSATWFAAFNEVDVPCMLVRDLGACYADEQARVNDYVVEVDDPAIGPAVQAGAPCTTTPPSRVRNAAPRLGEHELLSVVRDFGRLDRPAFSSAAASPPPLDGITVLDLGTMIATPFGAQCFADFGARVVKVERLDGDRGRTLTQFAGANRGKQSVALDLKHPAAAEPLRRMITSADVVVHNIRAGAARRLGLDLESLRAINPTVVLSHVSANGAQGPMAAFPGYDPTAQALTGWERANVGTGQDPMWMRNSVLDVGGGLASFVGGLLALYHREATGEPADSGTSLLSVGIAIASETALGPSGAPFPVPEIDPDQTGTSPWQRIYATADGWIAVAATSPEQQRALVEVAGVGDDLEAAFSSRDRDELLAALDDFGVPATLVREEHMHPFFDDADNRRHGVSRHLDAADYGGLDVVGGFWTLDGPCADEVNETIPALGADTVEVLAAVGYEPAEIAGLAADGVLHPSLTGELT